MPPPNLTGSVLEVLNSDRVASDTVTIPAATEMLLVTIAYYPERTYDVLTIGGSPLTEIVTFGDSGAQNVAIWYIVNPPTGVQTLAWDVAVLEEGAIYHLIPLVNVDTANPITGSALGSGSSTPTTAPFASSDNDTIYFVGSGYLGAVNAAYGAGQTQLRASAVFNNDAAAVGTKPGVAGTTTVQVQGPDGFTTVAAVSVRGVAGGPSPSLAPIVMYNRRQRVR